MLKVRLFVGVAVVAIVVSVALLPALDDVEQIGAVRGSVTHHQNSSPRAGSSFKTIWVTLENGATTSFTTSASVLIEKGRCVEFLHLRGKYSRLASYRFSRYC